VAEMLLNNLRTQQSSYFQRFHILWQSMVGIPNYMVGKFPGQALNHGQVRIRIFRWIIQNTVQQRHIIAVLVVKYFAMLARRKRRPFPNLA